MPEVVPLKKMDRSRYFALLSYVLFLCVIPLVFRRNDPFVLSHARQGLALFLCEFAVLLTTIILPFLASSLWLACLVLACCGMVMALRGQAVRLPLIAGLSDRIVL